MLWIVTGVWLVAVVIIAGRHVRTPTRGTLAAFLVVALAGIAPYLWFLFADQLPAGYATAMAVVWVLLAVGSVVWRVSRQRRGRDGG